MKKKAIAFGVIAVLAWAVPDAPAEDIDSYVYTFDGRSNLTRNKKVSEVQLDMPVKNGDTFKIEKESCVDYVFFTSMGVRVTGPADVSLRSVTSLSGLEMYVSSGEVLLHARNSGDSFQLSLETPHVVASTTNPNTLALIVIEPPQKVKGGSGGKTAIFVKSGILDVLAKIVNSTVRVTEGQTVEIGADETFPRIRGAMDDELKPVDQARGVYVPKERDEDSF